MPEPSASPAAWLGRDLGTRTVSWDERDVILYALAVGARPDELDLVFEDRLRVLPGFALTLAQWAPDVLGTAGAFDVTTAVHGSQSLRVVAPLPPRGSTDLSARVSAVWDKSADGQRGSAVFDVEVSCDHFVATWSLFCPGAGGFGGERGPGRAPERTDPPDWVEPMPVAENAALLYRLLGDRHPIHVDPAAARVIGAQRPILHGLATLAGAGLVAARHHGSPPWQVSEIGGRFSRMVLPGQELSVAGWADGGLRVSGPAGTVIEAGTLTWL